YEIERDKFRFKLSRKGEKANIQLMLPYTLNMTEYVEIREEATNFAIAARKRMAGMMIEAIEQYNEDRILLIKLIKGEERANIIIEMFGKGNLIISDNEMKILLAYDVHSFKDREIKPSIEYIPPKKNQSKKERTSIAKP